MITLIRITVFGFLITSLPQASAEQPPVLSQTSQQGPMTFVASLIEARIPVGIEIRGSDYIGPTQPSRVAPTPAVSVSGAIRAFNLSHTEYIAALVDGVVVIRPSRRRVPYLDQPSSVDRLDGRGLMRVTTPLFLPLGSVAERLGGIAGSTLGPVDVQVDRGETLDVVVQASGRTVLQTLNEIAKQAPGHAWLIVTGDNGIEVTITKFGFVHHLATTEQKIPTRMSNR